MTTINLKSVGVALAGICLPAAALALPQVTGMTLSQDAATRVVTINYTMTGAPAVITLDIETKDANGVWSSIGGKDVCRASGDVWKRVSTSGGTITWIPGTDVVASAVAADSVRALVKAWSIDDTPDYMVVDISDSAQPDTARYYPSIDFVPGGVLENSDYRVSKLLMRKIPAAGIRWTMGSVFEDGRAADETPHVVVLDHDYYMGVFEVTQAQWYLVKREFPRGAHGEEGHKARRPVESVAYNEIRCASNTTAAVGGVYPADPQPGSFLAMLRNKTGLKFDLPSEAEWEFACRAGNGEGQWGDGSRYCNKTTDANLPGRYIKNGGSADGSNTDPGTGTADYATAEVGSYSPNAWGLYDMHGNVYEWCLDWYAADITGLNGAVNTTTSTARVRRGGCWWLVASACRSASRGSKDPTVREKYCGLRVVCPMGLE